MRPAVGGMTGRGVGESLSRLRCVRERAQGHPNSNLLLALTHRVRTDRVHPNRGEEHRHQREQRQQLHVEPWHRRGDGVLHRPDVRDRLIRINAANLILNRRRHREWRGDGSYDEEHVRE